MGWPASPRPAKALLKLLAQVNALAPDRSKRSDGMLGDAAHASRSSDHNPHVRDNKGIGVVTAVDITHDPARGVDSYKLAEVLRENKDPRIKYIISNKKICSSTTKPWQWRPYSGKNPHNQHVHVSVKSVREHYDSQEEWIIDRAFEPVPINAIVPVKQEPDRPMLRRGNRGDHVVALQKMLGVEPDGDFGLMTETAVKRFQKDHKLTADGIVGPYTWEALEKKAI